MAASLVSSFKTFLYVNAQIIINPQVNVSCSVEDLEIYPAALLGYNETKGERRMTK
ncbi:hypothetical protein BSG1_15393 [Bacillus sp. SG-1]|nr:hypothetical protein BSG1_15393 [Bacillus sp. SG-1]